MKNITITTENGETFSSISNFFIDYYMTTANGEFVKIYLYLIRLLQAGHPVSIQDVADHFECTQKDICRAIRYWVDRNLLRLEYNQKGELLGITIMRPPVPDMADESDSDSGMELLNKRDASNTAGDSAIAAAPPAIPQETAAADTVSEVPAKKPYSQARLAAYEKDQELGDILFQFEMYCGHTPTQTELNSLLYIYEQLHFSSELLQFLIEYCASLQRTSYRYIEKVAIDWYTRGISSAEQAKQETSAYHELNSAISKELGLTRVLTPTDLKYINTWRNDYALQPDIIIEACRRAVAENKGSFKYINGIITSWHNSHVESLQDIRQLDEQFHAQKKATADTKTIPIRKVQNLPFNNFEQRTYNDQELDDFFIHEVQKMTKEN